MQGRELDSDRKLDDMNGLGTSRVAIIMMFSKEWNLQARLLR